MSAIPLVSMPTQSASVTDRRRVPATIRAALLLLGFAVVIAQLVLLHFAYCEPCQSSKSAKCSAENVATRPLAQVTVCWSEAGSVDGCEGDTRQPACRNHAGHGSLLSILVM